MRRLHAFLVGAREAWHRWLKEKSALDLFFDLPISLGAVASVVYPAAVAVFGEAIVFADALGAEGSFWYLLFISTVAIFVTPIATVMFFIAGVTLVCGVTDWFRKKVWTPVQAVADEGEKVLRTREEARREGGTLSLPDTPGDEGHLSEAS